MFYLASGSRYIHSLSKLEATHAMCESCVVGLERRVGELGEGLRLYEQKCQLLVSEKAILDDARATL